MTPKLTSEMRAALAKHPDRPLEIEDDETQKVYLLVDRQQALDLFGRWIIEELQIAEADIEAGRVVAWDLDQMTRKLSKKVERGQRA